MSRVGFHQLFETRDDDAVELFEERPFPEAADPFLPGEIGDGEGRDLGFDQLVVDVDGALNERPQRFLPAQVVGLDLTPVARKPRDQPGNAFAVDVTGVELEVPVLGADVVLEPLRFLLGGEELAEQQHRVPFDEYATEVEDGDQRIDHGKLAGLVDARLCATDLPQRQARQLASMKSP